MIFKFFFRLRGEKSINKEHFARSTWHSISMKVLRFTTSSKKSANNWQLSRYSSWRIKNVERELPHYQSIKCLCLIRELFTGLSSTDSSLFIYVTYLTQVLRLSGEERLLSWKIRFSLQYQIQNVTFKWEERSNFHFHINPKEKLVDKSVVESETALGVGLPWLNFAWSPFEKKTCCENGDLNNVEETFSHLRRKATRSTKFAKWKLKSFEAIWWRWKWSW